MPFTQRSEDLDITMLAFLFYFLLFCFFRLLGFYACAHKYKLYHVGFFFGFLACLVINPITVNGYAALFNCTPVDRASDSMMAPT